jgi:translation initiation factor 4G
VDLPTSLNSHGYPQRPGSKECVYFMKHGTCSYGANCVHHHPEMVASVPGFGPAAKLPRSGLASLGGGIGLRGGNGAAQPYPQRPGEIDCKYYLQHGTCSYRASCKFNHPPRA